MAFIRRDKDACGWTGAGSQYLAEFLLLGLYVYELVRVSVTLDAVNGIHIF